MTFRNSDGLCSEPIQMDEPLPIVVGLSGQSGSTLEQVAGVRNRYEKDPQIYDSIFSQINNLSVCAATALADGNYQTLGHLMDTCHGLLNALQVSTPDLENLVAIARSNGAVGAKLTGGGGGGAVVALCPGSEDRVRSAMHRAGYLTLQKIRTEDS